MFEEEYPSPGLHSQSEQYVLLQLTAMGLCASWALGGMLGWVSGYLACLGALTPIIIEGHRRHGLFNIKRPRRMVALALTPVWVAIIVFLTGLFFISIHEITIGDIELLTLVQTPWWAPSNVASQSGWLTMLYQVAIYTSAVGLIFVALTTTLVRRLLIILTTSASLIALIGFIQLYSGTNKLLWSLSTYSEFFAIFPHSEQYAGFALLWSLAFLGLLLHLRRQKKTDGLVEKWGLIMFVGWGILTVSVFVSGTLLHWGLLVAGIGWCITTEGAFATNNGAKKSGAFAAILGILIAITGIVFIAANVAGSENVNGLTSERQSIIWQDSWKLFLEKPIFGWGVGSFLTIIAFKQEVDFGQNLLTPHSDLLHLMVEQGVIGVVIWLAPPVILLIIFLKKETKRLLSAHLWTAAIMIGVLALFSFPLQNPATAWSLWFIIGAAHVWTKVQRKDPAIALKSDVVFDESEMRSVPKLDKPLGKTRSRIEERRKYWND
ncbi:O-antigen ligase family protein [Rubellicoccus peritrichatus]|uniref:O-antigen ligase family protein n=1 Tax=Rubellicoccus peritrichatus TaxID=3080537 RepID=A0AAQ3LCI8_9BACT|nr:O-antigen ligase family protein [Puniceicoccus sp. CR14]WOO41053.1 O-antigen ligase family protein [Puniceicoccus sp. CR14]